MRMNQTTQTAMAVFLGVFMGTTCTGQGVATTDDAGYRSPEIFEEDIQHFEAADREQPPPKGAIVCVGSSSIRGWHETIRGDLSPLTVMPRGFGGSNMNDVLHFADRIVLPYAPRAIVIYEGDNDIAGGIFPETVAETFRAFLGKVHEVLPNCRVYFLSIKPSPSRWAVWPEMKRANEMIAETCAEDPRLTFVDVASGMLDEKGKPRADIFQEDQLHMTRAGYLIWRDALRPILLDGELSFERAKDPGDAVRE